MTTNDPTTASPPSSWLGIQTVGPALLIVFGLVLMFTPIATVGAAGSVGNAGVQFPKCPPSGGGGQVGGNFGNVAFVVPDDCPPTTAAPTTAAPTTAAPTTAAPTTAAPTTAAPTTAAAEPDEELVPEVGGLTETAPETEVLSEAVGNQDPSDSGARARSGDHQASELAFTGPHDSSLLASILGAVMVLSGAGLLFVSRRRTHDAC